MAEMRVEGLRELQRAMLELPRRLSRRILLSALMAGAKPMVDDAKSRAPMLQQPDARRSAGNLRRAIRARPVRSRDHTSTVAIGVRKLSVKAIAKFKTKRKTKAANNPSDPFYWRFQEFAAAGKPLQPFLRPAFEAKKTQAATTIRDKIRDRVIAEANALGKGQ